MKEIIEKLLKKFLLIVSTFLFLSFGFSPFIQSNEQTDRELMVFGTRITLKSPEDIESYLTESVLTRTEGRCHILIKFNESLTKTERQHLNKFNIILISRLLNSTFIASIPGNNLSNLSQIDFINGWAPIPETSKMDKSLRDILQAVDSDSEKVTASVFFYENIEEMTQDEVLGWAGIIDESIEQRVSEREIRLKASPEELELLAKADAVSTVWTDIRPNKIDNIKAQDTSDVDEIRLPLLFASTMDENPNWIYQNQWNWGQPIGLSGDPHGGYTGANVIGYNLDGQYPNSMSAAYVTSQAIDCSGATHVALSFYKWLGIESASYDHASIQVSSDGGSTWSTVWEHTGSSVIPTTWTYVEYDITTWAAGQSDVRLRWVMGPTDSSVTYCGWNIDDVIVSFDTSISGYNLTGNGIKLALWDGGEVRTTHEQFNPGNRVTQGNDPIPPGEPTPPSDYRDHATHVCGTILGDGNPYYSRGGMAPLATADFFFFNYNDEVYNEVRDNSANIAVSNHSWGQIAGWNRDDDICSPGNPEWVWYGGQCTDTEDKLFGKYDSYAREIDRILCDNNKHIVVKSAGNDRGDSGPLLCWNFFSNDHGTGSCTSCSCLQKPGSDGNPDGSGYDSISGWGNAKNIITVGAITPIENDPISESDIQTTDFSSFGPSDDGRVKPDIVADGAEMESSIATDDDQYGTMSGTSMAAPVVTGTIGLLCEMYERYNSGILPNSSLMKALLINTAIDDDSPRNGPDYRIGWGLMNARGAADLIYDHYQNQRSHIIEDDYQEEELIYSLYVPEGQSFTITMAWSDPAGFINIGGVDDGTITLQNDLDLAIQSPFNQDWIQSWTLRGDTPSVTATRNGNHCDNVEQIDISQSESPGGIWTVRVGHTDTLLKDIQSFSLVSSVNTAFLTEIYADCSQIDASDFPEISLIISVTDQNGNAVPNLDESNFDVVEDGVEEDFDITHIEASGGLSVALVMDVSGSMSGQSLQDAKDAANGFINQMGPLDKVAIIEFSSYTNVQVAQSFTGDQDALHTAVNNLSATGSTALFDGICLGLDETAGEIGVKAVIAFTDGDENDSVTCIGGTPGYTPVCEKAIQYGIPVYTIDIDAKKSMEALNSPDWKLCPNCRRNVDLIGISECSNGQFYQSSSADLSEIYMLISATIQDSYLIRYISHNTTFQPEQREITTTAYLGGLSTSGLCSYHIGQAPNILRTDGTVQLGLTAQLSEMPLSIEAHVNDDSSVTAVHIYFRQTGSGSFYTEADMLLTTDDIYSYTIHGNLVIQPGLDYYITAEDGTFTSSEPSENPSAYPFQISVLPNEAPTISHDPISEAYESLPVNIRAIVFDSTSYIENVIVYYRLVGDFFFENQEMIQTQGAYSAQISAAYIINPGIEYYITACDNYGTCSNHGTSSSPHFIYVPECHNHGDVNADGIISNSDVSLAFRIAMGMYTPTHEEFCTADCNADGYVSSGDLQSIFYAILGIGGCVDPL